MAATRNEYLSYIATTLTIHMLFAPKQESFEDIPVLIYDVAGGEYEFKRMIYARDLRMHEIAGFHIGPYSVPVTPVRNPATGRSHHIVRLIHKHEPRYSVDLLFCDCDLYLVAFRRSRVDQGWGQWYKFDDQNVPAFIDSVNLGMYSNHGSRLNATPGGYTSQTDMFYSLATYQDRRAQAEEKGSSVIDEALKKACAKAITTFSEAWRLNSIFKVIAKRCEEDKHSALDEREWNLMHDWGLLSNVLMTMRLDGDLNLDSSLPDWCHGFGFTHVRDLIGLGGELRIIHHNLFLLGLTQKNLQKLAKASRGEIPNPSFPSALAVPPWL